MEKKFAIALFAGCVTLWSMTTAIAAVTSITIPMALVSADGQQKSIGTVTAKNADGGVLLTPNLHDLPPGEHGFHIHEKPSCDDNGMAAGDHLDPAKTEKHRGPFDKTGHLGDLPVLVVNADGTATIPALAPRFTLKQLHGHALMIHAGPDNYSDTPEKNGGGAARYACGVIK